MSYWASCLFLFAMMGALTGALFVFIVVGAMWIVGAWHRGE